MIYLSRLDYDVNGAIEFKEDSSSRFREDSARVNRVATLDGGAFITHRGYSDGDRTFRISALLDSITSDRLYDFFRTEGFIRLSCKEGAFIGAISDMRIDGGNLEMNFLVKETL